MLNYSLYFRSPRFRHSRIDSRHSVVHWHFRCARLDKILHLHGRTSRFHLRKFHCHEKYQRLLFRRFNAFFSVQFVLIFICESIYRKEKLRKALTLHWTTRSTCKKKADAMQLNCCSANSEVESEKVLTRTLVRDRKINDYAIVVSNLQKAYDDFTAVNGIDFVVKKGEPLICIGRNGSMFWILKFYCCRRMFWLAWN